MMPYETPNAAILIVITGGVLFAELATMIQCGMWKAFRSTLSFAAILVVTNFAFRFILAND